MLEIVFHYHHYRLGLTSTVPLGSSSTLTFSVFCFYVLNVSNNYLVIPLPPTFLPTNSYLSPPTPHPHQGRGSAVGWQLQLQLQLQLLVSAASVTTRGQYYSGTAHPLGRAPLLPLPFTVWFQCALFGRLSKHVKTLESYCTVYTVVLLLLLELVHILIYCRSSNLEFNPQNIAARALHGRLRRL